MEVINDQIIWIEIELKLRKFTPGYYKKIKHVIRLNTFDDHSFNNSYKYANHRLI